MDFDKLIRCDMLQLTPAEKGWSMVVHQNVECASHACALSRPDGLHVTGWSLPKQILESIGLPKALSCPRSPSLAMPPLPRIMALTARSGGALTDITLAYGRATQTISLPQDPVLWIRERERPPSLPAEETLLRRALRNPLGMERLSRLVRPGQRVAVVVSDITRPARPPGCCPLCCRSCWPAAWSKRTFALCSRWAAIAASTPPSRPRWPARPLGPRPLRRHWPRPLCGDWPHPARHTRAGIPAGGRGRLARVHRQYRVPLLRRLHRRSQGPPPRRLQS